MAHRSNDVQPDSDQERPIETTPERELLTLVPPLVAALRSNRLPVPEDVLDAIQSHGLGTRHIAVLMQLGLGGAQSVGELSACLGVTLATTSQMVGELSRAGIIERREDPDDRRRTIVNLAPDYVPALAETVAAREALLKHVLARLSPSERDGFVKGMRAFAEVLIDQPGSSRPSNG